MSILTINSYKHTFVNNMKKEKTTLAQRLRALRDLYELSQSDFASFIGMKGHQGILKIESGETLDPRKSTLENIANVYGTTYEWLTYGEGEMLPEGKKALQKVGSQTVEPWRDEAYAIAKQQLEKKDKEIEVKDSILQNLAISFDRVTKMMQDSGMSFLRPVGKTG